MSEEKKRAALADMHFQWVDKDSHSCREDVLEWMNQNHYLVRTLLQPSPIDAEVREAVEFFSLEMIDAIVTDASDFEDCRTIISNHIKTLIRAATKNMGEK